ncbi:MAG: hypothetical protein ACKO2K_01660 [Alphaproteobacteria bacterium]
MTSSSPNLRRARLVAAALLATAGAVALLATGEASAQARASGTQMTPDSRRYLINKDVGGERWAISYNLQDRTVTGNVFQADGSAPSFVWCTIASHVPAGDPAANQYLLDCWGAPQCEAAPCSDDDWKVIQQGIPIGGSFLLPPGTRVTFKANIEPVLDAQCATTGCHAGTSPAQGLDLSSGKAYDAIFRKPSSQDADHLLVEPFDPEASHLFGKITGAETGARMPLGGAPLSDEVIGAFRQWILEGAAEN